MKHQGIYIAGAGKDAGKTTLSLGLVSWFMENLQGSVSFLKPLGQKTTMVDGKSVGEDSWFLNEALNLGLPLDSSAPFAAESGAAERYISSGEPSDIPVRIRKAFRLLSSRSDLVVVEGTGHPGVGSVFGLSNADVASILDIPVILVLDGGIGSTIDKFTLCRAIFDRDGVRIAGVVVNRILPSGMDRIRNVLIEWFSKEGVPVFGFIPFQQSISRPSLGMLSRALKADVVGVPATADSAPAVSGFITAFGSRNEVLGEVAANPSAAVILSAARMDIIDALVTRRVAGGKNTGPGAIVLCGKGGTNRNVVAACDRLSIPVFSTGSSMGQAASRVSGRIFKVEPDESIKIEEMVELVKTNVDIKAVLHSIANSPEGKEERAPGFVRRLLARPIGYIRKLINGSRR